jgi:hypothetical protein
MALRNICAFFPSLAMLPIVGNQEILLLENYFLDMFLMVGKSGIIVE